MKKINVTLLSVLVFLLTAYNSGAQQNKQAQTTSVEIIQFHSEHRCFSCLKIEKLTRATIANSFPSMPFTLVNVDDKKNEKMAEQFEATGTALFLYNPDTGKKKDITDFAFMNCGDENKFETELKKYIDEFIKIQ